MITYDNIKTIADLVKAAGEVHGERIFIRYEHDDVVKDVSFAQFAKSCGAVA